MLVAAVIPHHHHPNGMICMKQDLPVEQQCPTPVSYTHLDQLTQAANSNLAGALQGKVSGLDVKPSSGMPGASSQITIQMCIRDSGNIGHYVLEALQAAPDFEIAGVVRRAGAENKPEELANLSLIHI